MEITTNTIEHLASLSNFSLTDEERSALKADLTNIFAYIKKLDELDTSNVEPTYQVFEMQNVWRSDEITPQDADREALLALSKATESNQIKVPKVL